MGLSPEQTAFLLVAEEEVSVRSGRGRFSRSRIVGHGYAETMVEGEEASVPSDLVRRAEELATALPRPEDGNVLSRVHVIRELDNTQPSGREVWRGRKWEAY